MRACQYKPAETPVKGSASIDVHKRQPGDAPPNPTQRVARRAAVRLIVSGKAPAPAGRPSSASCKSSPPRGPIPLAEKRRRELALRDLLRPTAAAFWAAADAEEGGEV